MGHHHSHGSGGGKSHSHHSHRKDSSLSSNRVSRSRSLRNGSEKQNINVRAAFIHVLGDIVQSVGVLIAAYVIKFKVNVVVIIIIFYICVYFGECIFGSFLIFFLFCKY